MCFQCKWRGKQFSVSVKIYSKCIWSSYGASPVGVNQIKGVSFCTNVFLYNKLFLWVKPKCETVKERHFSHFRVSDRLKDACFWTVGKKKKYQYKTHTDIGVICTTSHRKPTVQSGYEPWSSLLWDGNTIHPETEKVFVHHDQFY